jgi:TPP-dependent pyruvate/acetoin dehydrogenase alpha subunit
VEREKAKDPIRIFADLLARTGILSQEELEKMDAEVKQVSEEAADFAENSPGARGRRALHEIYAEENVNGRLYFDMRNR